MHQRSTPTSAPANVAYFLEPPHGDISVKELTDEAFGRVADVAFPVDKVVDCLR